MKCPPVCRALLLRRHDYAGPARGAANLKIAVALAAVLCALPARAATNIWLPAGPSTNDWHDTNNWNTFTVPAPGDDVRITNNNVNVMLTNSTDYLSSILLSNNCTLVFSNWNTSLSATNVTIRNNAVMTLPAAFGSDAMSNRVWIICSNMTILAGGQINADGRGYRSGNGLGKANNDNGSAASYGGKGGYTTGGAPYGSAEAPLDPGSGGRTNNTAAQGGGAVRIDATGTVMINGTISANGNNAAGNYTGGGSGGGVYITCRALAGTGGVVRANGGSHGGNSGAGGGGRIAVVYDSAAQSNEPVPSVTFSVLPGSAGLYAGDIGTLYFPDGQLLTETIGHSGQWMAPGFTNWSVTNLTIANSSIAFRGYGFLLDVAGNLTITGATGRLYLGSNTYSGYSYWSTATSGPTLRIGGNLILTNSAQLHIFSGHTNDAVPYGARVDVTSNILVAGGARIYPYSQHDTGASPLFTVRNLTIASGGAIDASAKGYRVTMGTGKPTGNSGAGHGGAGGGAGGGSTYGNSNAPVVPGSGAGSSQQPFNGKGGGLARIEAGGFIRLDGTISANGHVSSGNLESGASGGGIFIVCRRFEGAGSLSAAGGQGNNVGGGGGGRIAVWHGVSDAQEFVSRLMLGPILGAQQMTPPLFTGTTSVAFGSGSPNGANGTALFLSQQPGTLFTVY